MAYAFNDDKSKVEVYSADEVYAKDEVYGKTELSGLFKTVKTSTSTQTIMPNKTYTLSTNYTPPDGYRVAGIVGVDPADYRVSTGTCTFDRTWETSQGYTRLSCLVRNMDTSNVSVRCTFYVLLVKTDFIDA